jgi:mono/diheme cytochrome c family protein
VPTIGAVRSREELMIRSMVCAMAVCVCAAGTARAQDAKTKGEQVFTDQKCSLCHSIAGKGNAKGSLDDVGKKDSADDIRQWLVDTKSMTAKTKATRKPEMKVYALPKEDVDALVVYLSSLKK